MTPIDSDKIIELIAEAYGKWAFSNNRVFAEQMLEALSSSGYIICQASDAEIGTGSAATPSQFGVGAEAYKPTVIQCAVSHLPAGHPNACCDCDPCLMHNPKTQFAAMQADWEGMYWEIKLLRNQLKRPIEEPQGDDPTTEQTPLA